MAEPTRRGAGDRRLDRLLVERQLGPRAVVQKLIRRGHVTVAGQLVRDPATPVPPDAPVEVDGAPCAEPPLALLYHKPVGVLSTLDDPWGRATLSTTLGEALPASLHPVGRLDADSRGLLLFSSDGALTQRLLHPRRAVEKEYVAEVEGTPHLELPATLAAGVRTADGLVRARVVSVEGSTVRLVVTEGKHRMVRRMLANVGHPVLDLLRVRIGEVRLGDLPPGEMRAPTPTEAAWLRQLAAR